MTSPDHYEILQVHPKASAEIIKRAYRTLCGLHHPDIVPPQERAEADRKMALINAAYAVLIDPSARREYDKSRLGAHSASVSQVTSATTHSGAMDARKCYRHPERARVSVCMICGHSICGECRRAEAMVVMCPDCTKRHDSGSVTAGSPTKVRGAGTDAVAAKISSQTSPIAALLRAHWFFKTLSCLVVAIAFIATIPLFMMAAVSMVALRFPMQTGLIWAVSIIISALAAVLVAVLLVITGAFLRLRYMLLALVVLLSAMAVGLHQVRQAKEPSAAVTELQAARYTKAAVLFTFAIAMGEQNADSWDGLGRTYLRLFLQKTGSGRDAVSPAGATYAKGALEAFDRTISQPEKQEEPVPQGSLVLGPVETVGVFLAAKAVSSGSSVRWWRKAERVLLSAPQDEDRMPSDTVRRIVLGLALFRHSEAIKNGLTARVEALGKPWQVILEPENPPGTASEQKQRELRADSIKCLKRLKDGSLKWNLGSVEPDMTVALEALFPAPPHDKASGAEQYQPPPQQRQQPVPHGQQPGAQGQQPNQPEQDPVLQPQEPTPESAQPDVSAQKGS
ncbi:MAG: DnaJ domain-containing protein [Armatimonadota bacterium]